MLPAGEVLLWRQDAAAGPPGRADEGGLLWLPAPPRGKRWRRKRRPRAAPHRSPLALERSLGSWEPISVTEACGLALRFAVDYLSWDELCPDRRAAALRQYLGESATADLGWSGRGRQLADLATPGRTVTLGDGAVIVVEITARVLGYRRTSQAASGWPLGGPTPSLAISPASAPPPAEAGWEPTASWWVQIAVPVRRGRDGQVVVDLHLDPTALNDK